MCRGSKETEVDSIMTEKIGCLDPLHCRGVSMRLTVFAALLVERPLAQQ